MLWSGYELPEIHFSHCFGWSWLGHISAFCCKMTQIVGILQMKIFHEGTFRFWCSPAGHLLPCRWKWRSRCALPAAHQHPRQGEAGTVTHPYGESRWVHPEFWNGCVPLQLSFEFGSCHFLARFPEAVSVGWWNGHRRTWQANREVLLSRNLCLKYTRCLYVQHKWVVA